ncbi:hypothetical protein D9M71_438840 [compost metagenome]
MQAGCFVAGSEGHQADMGDRQAVAGAGLLQAAQGLIDSLRQLFCLGALQAGGEQQKLAAPGAGHQEAAFTQLLQLLSNALEQLVGPLFAKTLVEPEQVINLELEEKAAAGPLFTGEAGVKLQVEIALVGQPGQPVLVGFIAQPFAAGGLFGEQAPELVHHLVHRLDDSAELRSARQFTLGEELAAGNGL